MSFRTRPGETAQAAGRRFEAFWAKFFGTEPVKGSGNLWYAKLDVPGGGMLFSCKHTENESFSLSKKLMREAEEATSGNGGSGEVPAIATSVQGEVFVTLRGEDFLRLLTDNEVRLAPSKGEQKRNRAKVPAIFRDDD